MDNADYEHAFGVEIYQSGTLLGGMTHHFYFADEALARGCFDRIRSVVADYRDRKNDVPKELEVEDDFGVAALAVGDTVGCRFLKRADLHAWGARSERYARDTLGLSTHATRSPASEATSQVDGENSREEP